MDTDVHAVDVEHQDQPFVLGAIGIRTDLLLQALESAASRLWTRRCRIRRWSELRLGRAVAVPQNLLHHRLIEFLTDFQTDAGKATAAPSEDAERESAHEMHEARDHALVRKIEGYGVHVDLNLHADQSAGGGLLAQREIDVHWHLTHAPNGPWRLLSLIQERQLHGSAGDPLEQVYGLCMPPLLVELPHLVEIAFSPAAIRVEEPDTLDDEQGGRRRPLADLHDFTFPAGAEHESQRVHLHADAVSDPVSKSVASWPRRELLQQFLDALAAVFLPKDGRFLHLHRDFVHEQRDRLGADLREAQLDAELVHADLLQPHLRRGGQELVDGVAVHFQVVQLVLAAQNRQIQLLFAEAADEHLQVLAQQAAHEGLHGS
eukprot:scaffold79_cov259-Pinguiococcus_pyrenoidosus.AAC.27